jgi:hypothetical protein
MMYRVTLAEYASGAERARASVAAVASMRFH